MATAIHAGVEMLDLVMRRQVETLEEKLEAALRQLRDLADRDEAARVVTRRLDQRLKNHEARLLSLERTRRR